jgi:ribonuclease T1
LEDTIHRLVPLPLVRLRLLLSMLLLPVMMAGLVTAGCSYIASPSDEGGSILKGSSLPHEALETLKLIQNDGPYPYKQDGTVFSNREGLLPQKANGYYREYTVKTPGASDRGARRIVKGKAGELYYTDDHYASFRRIVE